MKIWKWRGKLAVLLTVAVATCNTVTVLAAEEADVIPVIEEEEHVEEAEDDGGNEEIIIADEQEKGNIAEQEAAETQEYSGGTGEHDMSIKVPSIQEAAGNYARDYLAELPAVFDLREQGAMSSVKNQNPYNTCWSFAAISAAESNLLLEGAPVEPDFSELQFSHFFYNKPADPLGGTAGDGNVITDPKETELSNGGNLYTTALTAMEWMGLADESLMPYSGADSGSIWPDNFAYCENSAVVRNVEWMSTKDRSMIKQYLMEKGACVISFWYSSKYYKADTYSYYNPNSSAAGASGHAVTIAGWDDNYPKENFKEDYRPSADGAWLVKNSWGENRDDGGYFWMSYEEKRLNLDGGVAVFYDAVPAGENWENNYQYDGNGSLTYDMSYYQGTGMANVFTAKGTEYLEAAAVATWQPLQDYTLRIYLNPQKGKPESGQLVAEQNGSFVTAGYHTVELDERVCLNKGDTFSVVADFSRGGNRVPLLCAIEDSWDWVYFKSASADGQSYIDRGTGTWTSLGTSGNCRIKAFTTKTEAVEKITVSKNQMYLRPGKTQTLTSTLVPADIDSEIEWTSSNTKVAKVDKNGKITAVADGNAKITARAVKGM